MKVEAGVSTKLVISEVKGLDPITVHLEDHAPGRGGITIQCYGKAWSAGWGAMGADRTASEFVASCDAYYLIGCLAPMLQQTRFSSDELIKLAQKCVLDRRRGRNCHDWMMVTELDKREARELYNRIHDLHGLTSHECSQYGGLLSKLFGDEWWYKADDAKEPNPDWNYLERIVEAVRAAIKQQAEVPA